MTISKRHKNILAGLVVGMTMQEAVEQLESAGLSACIVNLNGRPLAVAGGPNDNRARLTVAEGSVTECQFG
jgi:hypothetical protein